MSDFDREAEREKLRKKYEAEQADREATQRMSDLLLRGATMTNRHCDECGDPLFRHEGRIFCPTCQREVEPATDASDAGEASAGAAAGSDPEAGADAVAGTDADAADAMDADGSTAAASDPESATEPAPTTDRNDSDAAGPEAPNAPSQPTHAPTTHRSTPPVDTQTDHDPVPQLAAAIDRFAARAAESPDPRRADEWLEAAERAAEVIAILQDE